MRGLYDPFVAQGRRMNAQFPIEGLKGDRALEDDISQGACAMPTLQSFHIHPQPSWGSGDHTLQQGS